MRRLCLLVTVIGTCFLGLLRDSIHAIAAISNASPFRLSETATDDGRAQRNHNHIEALAAVEAVAKSGNDGVMADRGVSKSEERLASEVEPLVASAGTQNC